METTTVRLGVARAVFLERTPADLRVLCEALEAVTGRSTVPVVLEGYDEIVRGFDRGELELGWLPPLACLRGITRGTMVPIAVPYRRGSSSFFSVLFSRQGSAFDSATRLVGARAAWVNAESTAGYLVIRARLVADGVVPEATFNEERFYESHREVARAVLEGRADVGATFAHGKLDLDEAGWTGLPGAENVRPLLRVGPIPHDVIAMSTRLRATFAEQVQTALLDDESPVGRAACALLVADRLVAPVSGHFDPLVRILSGK